MDILFAMASFHLAIEFLDKEMEMKNNLLLFVFIFFSIAVEAVEYKYDNAKRITKAIYKDGTVVSYKYDKNGNLLSVIPNKSPSNGDGSDAGSDDKGGTGETAPETSEPKKQKSSGGAFGWLILVITSGFITVRSRVRTKLKG